MQRPTPVELLAACPVWGEIDGGTLVIACSGGRDSVALALAAQELLHDPAFLRGFTAPPRLVVWHLDHGLREASAEDARFTAGLAAQLGIACQVEQAALRQHVGQPGINLEALAREERYSRLRHFLDQPPPELKLPPPRAALTAHHLGDQAETVLHHLVRGTGLRGLRGIAPVWEEQIYRPWLALEPREISAYLELREQGYREDETNCDVTLTRNKLRHQVLPLLREINPQADGHIARLADQAVEVEQAQESAIDELRSDPTTELQLTAHLPLLALPPAGYRVLNCALIDKQPEQLALAVLRLYRDLLGTLQAEDAAVVRRWIAAASGPLKHREVEVCWLDEFYLTMQATGPLDVTSTPLTLEQLQDVELPSGLIARCETAAQAATFDEIEELQPFRQIEAWPLDLRDILYSEPGLVNFKCQLPAEVSFPLGLRLPRDGDRIKLTNGATKKLGDVFTDAKIPLTFRRAWCVLTDAQDEVLWLPGLADSAVMRRGKRRPAWTVTLLPPYKLAE